MKNGKIGDMALNKALVVSIIVISLVMLSQYAYAGGKSDESGNPFDKIWVKLDDLQDQIDDIELTPGPKGDKGDPGEQGPPGEDGIDGVDGQNGIDGKDGVDGQDGIDGKNGLNSLIVISDEPAGTNCPNGGKKVQTGMDDDSDGILDNDEVDNTAYICDGEDGDSYWIEDGDDIYYTDGNVKVDRIEYNEPRTHYLSLGVESFTLSDTGSSAGKVSFVTKPGEGAYVGDASGVGLKAPLMIPDGANISKITFYYSDVTSDYGYYIIEHDKIPHHFDFVIYRTDLSDFGSEIIGKTSPSGSTSRSSVNVSLASSNDGLICYEDYTYMIYVYSTAWNWGGEGKYARFWGATIEYSLLEVA